MKQLLLIFFLALGLRSFGQQDRFIFIQAPKDHPFYVRLGEKTYSSSAFGHLVIPSLTDKNYQLFIGFPKTVLPEQEFTIALSGKDRGFDIRMEEGRSVFLYDWQSMQLIRSATPGLSKSEISINGVKRTDPYARLMAGVVNDSLVLYTEKPQPKDVAATSIPKKQDTVKVAIQDPVVPSRQPTLVAESDVQKDSTAIAVVPEVQKDSASIITDAKPEVVEGPAVVIVKEESTPDEKRIIYRMEDTKEEISIAIPKDPEPVDTVAVVIPHVQDTSAVVLMNSDCSRFATDNDVDKLRVQILKEGSNDEKIFVARKMFRTRCFSTKQIIALTELFPSDEGRYMFFDAAYPFVSDSGNFKSLIRFLSNEYYINRFKALVRM
jgi:hypothetical protein